MKLSTRYYRWRNRWVAARERRRQQKFYKKVAATNYGLDLTANPIRQDFNPKLDWEEATKDLDEAGLGDEYVEVLPLHYKEDGNVSWSL